MHSPKPLSRPLLSTVLSLGVILVLPPGSASSQEAGWIAVTDGKSGAGFAKYGNGNVTYGQDGVITVTGGNGYLATEKEYTHFRTRIEWHNVRGGNSGFLYHVGRDGIWPAGLECQMHSDDVGSLWTSGGARFNTTGTHSGREGRYSETGGVLNQVGLNSGDRYHFIRSQNPDAPTGRWNTWEMYVKGDSLEIKANGKVTMRVWKLTVNGSPLTKGRIGLQIEGAEVRWRNWEIQDLTSPVSIAMPAGRADDSRALIFGRGPLLRQTVAEGVVRLVYSTRHNAGFMDLIGRKTSANRVDLHNLAQSPSAD